MSDNKLPQLGQLTASQIQTVLGGVNPIGLSEYYSDVLGRVFIDAFDGDTEFAAIVLPQTGSFSSDGTGSATIGGSNFNTTATHVRVSGVSNAIYNGVFPITSITDSLVSYNVGAGPSSGGVVGCTVEVGSSRFGKHPETGSPISFGDFYGDSAVKQFVISENRTELDLYPFLVDQGWDRESLVEVIINEGVYVFSTNSRSSNNEQFPALKITGEYPNGLTIINNGFILGAGGKGSGRDGADLDTLKGSAAISIITPTIIEIINNGIIAGGGGGGAGSSAGTSSKSGGGGGAGGGNGGSGLANTGPSSITHSGAGGAGATIPGEKGGDGDGASGDVVGKGGEAGGGGGGFKNV